MMNPQAHLFDAASRLSHMTTMMIAAANQGRVFDHPHLEEIIANLENCLVDMGIMADSDSMASSSTPANRRQEARPVKRSIQQSSVPMPVAVAPHGHSSDADGPKHVPFAIDGLLDINAPLECDMFKAAERVPIPRRAFTIESKIEVLDMLAAGETVAKTARTFDIDPKSVRNYRDQEEALRNTTRHSSSFNLGGRKSLYPELDAKLVEFFYAEQRQGRHATYKQLVRQADSWREELGVPSSLIAGVTWMGRWARRNNVQIYSRKSKKSTNNQLQ